MDDSDEADESPKPSGDRLSRPARLAGALTAGALVLSGVALLSNRTYSSRAVVQLDPVLLDELLVADQPAPSTDDAYARELARIEGPEIGPQVQAQLDAPLHYRAERGDGGSVVLITSADTPGDARAAAERLAATYVANRQQGTGAAAALQGTYDELAALGVVPPESGAPPAGSDAATVATVTALQTRLAGQREAMPIIQAGETAVLVEGPELELGPAHLPLALVGLGMLIAISLLIVHLVRDEHGRLATDREPGATTGTWRALTARIHERAGHPVSLVALAAIGALIVVRAGVYALAGIGFVADDWLIQGNLDRFGLFGTADGLALSARSLPVAWTVYNLVFGLAGDHPLALFAIGTMLNLAVAGLLYTLLDRIFTQRIAFAVTALWILLPNHSSLTVWGSTVQARTGLILLFGGMLLLLRGQGSAGVGAGACFVAAAFSYELTVPVAFAAIVALPSAGHLTWRHRTALAGVLLAAALWLRANPHYPIEFHLRNPIWVWSGHFGAGLLGTGAAPLQARLLISAAVALGAVVCLALWLAGDRRWDGGPGVTVSGLAILALGLSTLNSTAAGLTPVETGTVDRLFATSSIGSALVLVGIGLTVHERHKHLARAGAALVVLVCIVGTVHSARTWADATETAADMVGALGDAAEDPASTRFIMVPGDPWRRGVTGQTPETATAALIDEYGARGGSVDFAGSGPIPPDAVAVEWSDVRGRPLPEDRPAERLWPEWTSVQDALEQTGCAAIALVSGGAC